MTLRSRDIYPLHHEYRIDTPNELPRSQRSSSSRIVATARSTSRQSFKVIEYWKASQSPFGSPQTPSPSA